jgi:hypothetical protein
MKKSTIKADKTNLSQARAKLQNLKFQGESSPSIAVISFIRELFDEINDIIVSKSAKTQDIYDSIKPEIESISYSHFTTILSQIRKERGITPRKRKLKTSNTTTPLPKQKTRKLGEQETPNRPMPNIDHIVIDENFISPLIDKDRIDYTSEDYQTEWDLVEQLLKTHEKSDIKMYRILNGDINDIKEYNLNTVGGRRQSYTKVSNLLDVKKRHYQDLIRILK